MSLEFPLGILYLAVVLIGISLGWLLWYGVRRVFGPAVTDYPFLPFKWIAAAVRYPFTQYSLRRFRRQYVAEARAQAEAAAAREQAMKAEK